MSKRSNQNDLVTLPRPEFEALLEQAACRGARKALDQVGLHDDNAAGDINDLRDILSSLRVAKSVAFKTFVRWVTLGILTLIIAGILAKTGAVSFVGK